MLGAAVSPHCTVEKVSIRLSLVGHGTRALQVAGLGHFWQLCPLGVALGASPGWGFASVDCSLPEAVRPGAGPGFGSEPAVGAL